MNNESDINYQRISEAIEFLLKNFRDQPSLAEVAEHVHLSPYHFQRLFSQWAGVSPKKFLQFLNVEYAKKVLMQPEATLSDVAHQSGLSGTGRLHDLFVRIEGMTPGDFKRGGRALSIYYHWYETPFGKVIIANTAVGICFVSFSDGSEDETLKSLQHEFPNAEFIWKIHPIQQTALPVFIQDLEQSTPVKLHMKGTPFQLKVWQALLTIPPGRLSSYGQLAASIDQPSASRAVGSAIGKNPVAYLIPCHRVIQSSGIIGGYRWGAARKSAMIGWEAVKYQQFWSERLEYLADELKNFGG